MIKSADVRGYFKVLAEDYPEWLDEYINTKELQSQKYISVTCGTIYSDLYDSDIFFSSLDHSVAVALIVWHFTHDKKQTLAGLFHDISTPVFKHCVDFLNGDYLTQESTEDLTTEFIKRSDDIMKLLRRDGIELEEVNDYHIYPIADNDTPQLSADRLEYTLSNALFTYKLMSLDEIVEIYNDIEVQKNEFGIEELSFKTKAIARKFVRVMSKLSIIYMEDRTRFSMQLIADILKRLKDDGLITIKQLYDVKESDIIELIEKSKYGAQFDSWRKAKKVKTSDVRPDDVYAVNIKAKVRYIDPLCNGERMSKICKICKNAIDKDLTYDMNRWVYLDFEL